MIKKLSLLLGILFITSNCFAATYYVNTAADAGGDGTTTALTGDNCAFNNIPTVNSVTFAAGDSVLFNRGDTIRGELVCDSGSAGGGYITYGAYGTGVKPKILGSLSKSSTGDWTDEGGNLWYASATLEIGNIIFNNEASVGVWQSTKVGCDTQGDFWFDDPNNRVYMYSVGNPASFYTNIECAQYLWIIEKTSKSYVTIQDLDIRYSGLHAIAGSNSDHIICRDLDVSYIGGCQGGGAARLGNGIEFYDGASNITVERCRIDNIFDSAINFEGHVTADMSNNYIKNNIITNAEYGFEFTNADADATVSNFYIENNTFKDCGHGFGHAQKEATGRQGMCLRLGAKVTTATISGLYVRNNILDTATETLSWVGMTPPTMDYNDYYQTDPTTPVYESTYWPASGQVGRNVTDDDFATLALFVVDTSQDAHSISADPLFVSATDFHLQSGSPCINTGLTIATVTDDYTGVARPQGTGYDMGAFEYNNLAIFQGVALIGVTVN